MISKGANNFNEGLIQASRRGHEEIVELMLAQGADNLNEALAIARENNQPKIIKKLLLATKTQEPKII